MRDLVGSVMGSGRARCLNKVIIKELGHLGCVARSTILGPYIVTLTWWAMAKLRTSGSCTRHQYPSLLKAFRIVIGLFFPVGKCNTQNHDLGWMFGSEGAHDVYYIQSFWWFKTASTMKIFSSENILVDIWLLRDLNTLLYLTSLLAFIDFMQRYFGILVSDLKHSCFYGLWGHSWVSKYFILGCC